ncbi:unnamed protein product [Lepidochelys kempii]
MERWLGSPPMQTLLLQAAWHQRSAGQGAVGTAAVPWCRGSSRPALFPATPCRERLEDEAGASSLCIGHHIRQPVPYDSLEPRGHVRLLQLEQGTGSPWSIGASLYIYIIRDSPCCRTQSPHSCLLWLEHLTPEQSLESKPDIRAQGCWKQSGCSEIGCNGEWQSRCQMVVQMGNLGTETCPESQRKFLNRRLLGPSPVHHHKTSLPSPGKHPPGVSSIELCEDIPANDVHAGVLFCL